MKDYDEKIYTDANSIKEALHLFVILGSVASIILAALSIILAIVLWSLTPLNFGVSILVSTIILCIILAALVIINREEITDEKSIKQNKE